MNLLLMGARGSGKSTVGRLLAARLARSFVDLDERTLSHLGETSVTEAWARLGEPAWRDAEAQVLINLLAEKLLVIALGGGTPTVEGARQAIERACTAGEALVLWLRCPPATLVARLSHAPGDRPPLACHSDILSECAALLEQREPIYRALGDLELDASQPPERVVERIVEWRGSGHY